MAHSHVLLGAGTTPAQLSIRRIGFADLKDALAKGVDDFAAMPTHAMFLCVIYPIIGLVLGRLAFGYSILPLIYPLASGFALIGPLAALGLYELSRRREAGLEVSTSHAFDVLRSSSIGAIAALGILLLLIVGIWLAIANAIYMADFGYAPPASLREFAHDVLTTSAGWNLIIVGNGVGFCFAALVLTIGVVSFPLLLDRDVGAAVALLTSIRAVAGKSAHHGGLGFDRRRPARARFVAVFPRADGGAADPRSRDLASLPQGGRAGGEPAAGPSSAAEPALRRRLSGQSLPLDTLAVTTEPEGDAPSGARPRCLSRRKRQSP